jgi:hypothetical protein
MRSMLTHRHLFIVAALAVLTAAGCAPENGRLGFFGQNGAQKSTSATSQIAVLNALGQPIANAKILIGLRAGVPFPGNELVTGADGRVDLPAAWTDAQPVTIDAPGHVRATWLAQTPASVSLKLRRAITPQKLELKGQTSGFGNLQKDGWVDVGMVFPALNRGQLASLQVTDLISPEIDTIRPGFGQTIELPSNITLPKQSETYVFPITLDKPVYRAFLHEPRTYTMVAAHARFPFEKVVDELRGGKSFYDVLNYFEFKSATLTPVNVTGRSQSQDLTVNKTKFSPALDITAPRFASNFAMLAVSVIEEQGLLYPTDVKSLSPQQKVRLVAPPNAPGLVVGALRDSQAPTNGPEADAMSVVVAPNNQTSGFDFIDIPNAPKAVATASSTSLETHPPKVPTAAIDAAVTYAMLTKVDTIQSGKMQIDSKLAVWDVYAPGWVNRMELPAITGLKGEHRWEVMFGAAAKGQSVPMGPGFAEAVSHVAKSASKL